MARFDTSEFDVNDLVTAYCSPLIAPAVKYLAKFLLWESCYSSCQQPMPLVKDRFQL